MKRMVLHFPLRTAFLTLSGIFLFPLCGLADEPLQTFYGPAIHYPVKYDISPPLRDIKPLPLQAQPRTELLRSRAALSLDTACFTGVCR